MPDCAEHQCFSMPLSLAERWLVHLGVSESVLGLGHCEQTHRKGRFILLQVSEEGTV